MEFNLDRTLWPHGMTDWSGIIDEIRRAPERAALTLKRFYITPAYLQALAAPLPSTGEPYSRKILFSGKVGEVMLAHWHEGSTCAPHDHGQSRGIVWLAAGEFRETSFEFQKERGLVALDGGRRFSAGAALRVEPGDIHSMKVFGIGLSLHIYFPTITAMKVYDAQSRTTLTVTDNCGAWIPEREEDIVKREAWT